MAHERRGERGVDHGRSRALRRLALAPLTAALLVAGCSDATGPDRAPLPFGPAEAGGTGGPGTGSSPIVGQWERFEVVAADGDLLTTTVHWLFDADGSCVRSITTFSANEGFPRTELRECTWSLGPGEITIRIGTDPESTFDAGFGGFDPNLLILDGFEYRRVA